ncbi:MAG: winged helix-turn-helix domain-containing tetratricopeptide repeat protein [Gammaproteobacteria bacterium]
MAAESPQALTGGFQIAGFNVFPLSGQISGPDGDSRVQPKVMEVLVRLAASANEVVPRQELLNTVWGKQVVVDEALTRCVSELRKVFGSGAIETVPKIGYRLVGRVEVGVDKGSDLNRIGIAVLPFLDLSPERDQEYFTDGLAEELLNLLTRISALRVPARTTSFTFKTSDQDVCSIAEQMNVDYVLEGSVRKSGDRLRITTQLINGTDGIHRWSENYDVTLSADVFGIQDDVAAAIVRELNLQVLGTALPKVTRVDPEAHNLVLLGRYQLWHRSALDGAVANFEKALAIEPRYALAWASLAKCHALRAGTRMCSTSEGYVAAEGAARRALELDPDLPEAADALGWILWGYFFDWQGAEQVLTTALAKSPTNARLLNSLANVVLTRGRINEAFRLWETALSYDPLQIAIYHNMGLARYYMHELTVARQLLLRALEIAPGIDYLHFCLARVSLLEQRPEAALAEARKEPAAAWKATGTALAYHALGDSKNSDNALNQLIEIDQTAAAYACEITQVYAWRNQIDEAFTWLDTAYERSEEDLADARYEPMFEHLHADPRWQEFLEKMNLTDGSCK